VESNLALVFSHTVWQCMRKSPLQKPDKVLRYFPLEVVAEWGKKISGVLLLHPDPLHHGVPRQRCFCKTKSTNKMLLCDGCDEWYHHGCIGVDEEEAAAAVNWRCGYCLAAAADDGNRAWSLAVPQGNRKRPKIAPSRNDADAPKARGNRTI
jgi:hypothetical protein